MLRRWTIAEMSSSSAIQLMYCLPEPRRPPIASLNGNSRRCSRPPCFASTSPVRVRTTRIPASAAALVSSSHATHTCAPKSLPGWRVFGEDVVAAVAVVPDRGRRHEHARLAIERRRACARAARCPASDSPGPVACAAGSTSCRRCPRRRGARRHRRLRGRRRRSCRRRDPIARRRRPRDHPARGGAPDGRRRAGEGCSAVPIMPCEPVRQMSTGTR